MKKRTILLSVIFLIILSGSIQISSSADKYDYNNEQIKSIEIPEIEELQINHTIDINIVFIGFDGYGIDLDLWNNELMNWYLPIASVETYETLPMYYNFDFNFVFTNKTTTNDFFNFLNSSWFVQPDPIPDYLVDWGLTEGSYIKGVSAITIENWLAYQFSYLPGYTLVLINSNDYVSYWYSYTIDFIDTDTGKSQYEGYMNCWAGNNTLAFYDYTTPPSNYGMGFGENNNFTYVPTLYDRWTGSNYDVNLINQDLIRVTQYTCDLLFTPSYLYYPKPYTNYVFYYLLIDCTSDGYAYDYALDFINPEQVKEAYNFILPNVNWDYKFLKMKLSSDPELETLVNDNYEDYGSYGILIASASGINDYLEDYWIGYENENTKVLPVIYFVFDKTTWYDQGSETGGTVARSNGKDGFGWEVVGCIDRDMTTGGTTALSTHEAGHFLGLRHPHDGWSWYNYYKNGEGEIVYWLWDYQATTMTYAFNYPYFNQMNKMQLHRGQMLMHLKNTYDNIIDAYSILASKNYEELPDGFSFILGKINDELLMISSSLDNYDYLYANEYSRYAEEYSNWLVEYSEELDEAEEPITITETETITINNTVTITTTEKASYALLGFIALLPMSIIIYTIRKRKNNG